MQHRDFSFQLRLWLEAGEGFAFGQGTARLLALVEDFGSLRKAAEHMGMSYRRAWGRLKRLEKELGEPLLHKPGGNKLGYRLTDLGWNLVEGYTAWRESVAVYAQNRAAEFFPVTIAPSREGIAEGGDAEEEGDCDKQ